MPFYLRKSISLGPLRLNLSKTGLGASAGVKGLRVGMNALGKKYLHAGRGGLYYRRSLESQQPASEAAPRHKKTAWLWIALVLAFIVADHFWHVSKLLK